MIRTIVTVAGFAAFAAPAFATTYNTLSGEAPLVIAHRGASGYLPEHTLAGYELAIKLGADVVEPDVAITSDGHLVIMHDDSLARTTNVEDLFAPRNGGYATTDFTLAEIKSLTVEPTGTASTSYPGFTPSVSTFEVPTFEEFLTFVNDYNETNGTNVGIYPESKPVSSTEKNQKIVEAMKTYGFTASTQNSYLQTFDHLAAQELSAMEDDLGMDVAVAALGYVGTVDGEYAVYDYIHGSYSTLSEIATYADGVGVYKNAKLTAEFIAAAHALGLEVHGWTFNLTDPDAAMEQYLTYIGWGLDGFFTNYTDLAVAAIAKYEAVAPVPLPAALPMLLAGFGAFGVARTRRRAA
ncbi:glycerophosphodiester phosphodiesterase family protein [Tropicimonas sp. IMCC34043]|uniref:glycerophosphodiester phosphodiesterase family protein n=1 Tax=Tropicimonas sp. IMCC34043 TaxID=2248760 RepID=UPI000E28074E|nr:glycerophosphodiester phosphodiesterase family protein [Tropicimonas sp. IMCC34043]